MLNTVLASQVTSKACHPYKETAQPEEKKVRQTVWLTAKTFYFPPPHPPLSFLLWGRGRRYRNPCYQRAPNHQTGLCWTVFTGDHYFLIRSL